MDDNKQDNRNNQNGKEPDNKENILDILKKAKQEGQNGSIESKHDDAKNGKLKSDYEQLGKSYEEIRKTIDGYTKEDYEKFKKQYDCIKSRNDDQICKIDKEIKCKVDHVICKINGDIDDFKIVEERLEYIKAPESGSDCDKSLEDAEDLLVRAERRHNERDANFKKNLTYKENIEKRFKLISELDDKTDKACEESKECCKEIAECKIYFYLKEIEKNLCEILTIFCPEITPEDPCEKCPPEDIKEICNINEILSPDKLKRKLEDELKKLLCLKKDWREEEKKRDIRKDKLAITKENLKEAEKNREDNILSEIEIKCNKNDAQVQQTQL